MGIKVVIKIVYKYIERIKLGMGLKEDGMTIGVTTIADSYAKKKLNKPCLKTITPFPPLSNFFLCFLFKKKRKKPTGSFPSLSFSLSCSPLFFIGILGLRPSRGQRSLLSTFPNFLFYVGITCQLMMFEIGNKSFINW